MDENQEQLQSNGKRERRHQIDQDNKEPTRKRQKCAAPEVRSVIGRPTNTNNATDANTPDEVFRKEILAYRRNYQNLLRYTNCIASQLDATQFLYFQQVALCFSLLSECYKKKSTVHNLTNEATLLRYEVARLNAQLNTVSDENNTTITLPADRNDRDHIESNPDTSNSMQLEQPMQSEQQSEIQTSELAKVFLLNQSEQTNLAKSDKETPSSDEDWSAYNRYTVKPSRK